MFSSNHCSTSVAVSVSAVKSYRLAPKEKAPSGILIRPVAIPAITEPIKLGSFSSSAPVRNDGSYATAI